MRADRQHGIIGWYVPGWMADEHPDILDWKNLNKYADLFKTSESGDKGQFLGGDPTYVHERRGARHEPRPQLQGRLLRAARRPRSSATKQAVAERSRSSATSRIRSGCTRQVKLVRVKLPAYTDGCDADPKKVACDYPRVHPEQDRQHEVRRPSGGNACDARQELQVDERGPELGRGRPSTAAR